MNPYRTPATPHLPLNRNDVTAWWKLRLIDIAVGYLGAAIGFGVILSFRSEMMLPVLIAPAIFLYSLYLSVVMSFYSIYGLGLLAAQLSAWGAFSLATKYVRSSLSIHQRDTDLETSRQSDAKL